MNWGYKIMFLYLGFVALIMTLVFKCMHQKMDLVSDSYYEQELVYQDKLNAWENSNGLSTRVSTYQVGNNIILKFPEEFESEKSKGEIYFYRPSNAAYDVTFPIAIDLQQEQRIPTDRFQKGVYSMKVEWENNTGKKFYTEQNINIKK